MPGVYELVSHIYQLSSEYKFSELNSKIENVFGQWSSDNKWSEISSVLFSLDVDKIKKRTAELVLTHCSDNKKNIAMYKQFWQSAMDEFGGDEIRTLK